MVSSAGPAIPVVSAAEKSDPDAVHLDPGRDELVEQVRKNLEAHPEEPRDDPFADLLDDALRGAELDDGS